MVAKIITDTAWLVPPSDTWRGTVKQSFKTIEDFAKYFVLIPFGSGYWKPSGVMLHNTAAPDGKQWDATTPSTDPDVDGFQRLVNLSSYYHADPLNWLGGPHLFVDDERAFAFNPLWLRGTHCSCVNGTHIGIEMVGDFDVEDFASGRGALVRDFSIGIIATIMSSLGLDPDKLMFHVDCQADNHACPGKHVSKADVIARVKARMAGNDFNSHVVTAPVPVVPAVSRDDAVKHLQTTFNEFGILNDKGKPISVDGVPGGETKAALDALRKQLFN